MDSDLAVFARLRNSADNDFLRIIFLSNCVIIRFAKNDIQTELILT